MSTIENPLYNLHECLWNALEEDVQFCELVRPRNRRKDCVLWEPPFKDVIAESDTPEVAIVLSEITLHRRTSNGRLFNAVFDIGIQTSHRTDKTVLNVIWSIYRAINVWHGTLDETTWKNKQFTWDVYIDETKKESLPAVRSRGVAGWFSAIKVVAQLYFTKTAVADIT